MPTKQTPTKEEPKPIEANWTFLTNYSHVLICLALQPDLRMREVADKVGITERAVQRIVADLEGAGVLTRNKDGRRNQYDINLKLKLRHPVEAHCTVADLLKMVGGEEAVRHALARSKAAKSR